MLYTSRLCPLRPDLVPFCVYVRHYAAHHGRVGWPMTHTTHHPPCSHVLRLHAPCTHVPARYPSMGVSVGRGHRGVARSTPREGLKFDLTLLLDWWQVPGAPRRLFTAFRSQWPAYAFRTVPHQPFQEPRFCTSILCYMMWRTSPTGTIFLDDLIERPLRRGGIPGLLSVFRPLALQGCFYDAMV